MRKVAILSLGGTIAMGAKAASGGVSPSLTVEDLIASVPGISEIANLETAQICNLPSPQISFAQMSMLVTEIAELEARGFDGVVITQGTDTIEEASWLLDLCCHSSMAVIMTGAMRNPTQPGADGPANLLAAVQVAASDVAKGAGVLVVFNDQIHAARFVQKTHTSNVGAFASPSCGPLGWMSEGVPILPMRLGPLPQFANVLDRTPSKVPIIKPGLAEGSYLIEAALNTGIDGLVLEASGGGHTTPEIANAIGEAATRVPVILCSRTKAGSVLTQTYGYDGSEMDLLTRGLIPSGYLDACKARLLLMIAIMGGKNIDEVRTLFCEISA